LSWLKVDKRRKKIKLLRKGGADVPEEARAKMGWHGRAVWHGVVMPIYWQKFSRAIVAQSCQGA